MKSIIFSTFLLLAGFKTGAQWSLSDSSLMSQGVAVAFPHEDAAYALGSLGRLHKSTDKGVTWQYIHDFGPFLSHQSLEFVNKDTGFAYGYGWIERTFDGGNSWDFVPIWLAGQGVYLSNFDLVGEKVFASTESNDTVLILRSDDYTNSFDTIFTFNQNNAQPFAISMLDSLMGYVVNPNEPERIYFTNNGFSTIDTISITSGPLTLQARFEYVDSIYGFFYGSWGSMSNPIRNWSTTSSIWGPIDLDGFGVLPILDMDYYNKTFYASSLYGKIFRSLNYGVYWTEQNTPVSDPVQSIAFLDSLNGIAVSNNQLLHTSNGGFNNIDEIDIASMINVYPNPASNLVQIRTDLVIEQLDLYGLDGKLLEQTTDHSLNLSGYESGIYVLIVHTDKGAATKRIVKQ